MTTTSVSMTGATALDRQVGENVAMMLFRAGMQQQELCARTGMSRPTLSRKLQGRGVWTVAEVKAVADVFRVPPMRLLDDQPMPFDEWCAIRDSNPEPAGLQPPGVLELAA